MTNQTYDVIDGRKNSGGIVKLWTQHVPVEQGVKDQLARAASLPFIHSHVAAMPDCHVGIGCSVGAVIPTRKAIIPAAVGVDLGCGMLAMQTTLTASDLPDSLKLLREEIEQAIPHGRDTEAIRRGEPDPGSWVDPPDAVLTAWRKLEQGFKPITEKYTHLERQNHVKHLGTLGTGNHFIEVCLDEEQRVWVMLHSGSRGIGNAIGRHFIELAKKEMERWHIHLPDKDLAYLPTGSQYFDDYWEALSWAQDFARTNRDIMLDSVLDAMQKHAGLPKFKTEKKAINCHHNYVALENHLGANVYVTRKGAIRARKGDLGIIPGSMGAKSFIVEGRGNPDSFHSCSHGAGRKMSRTAARTRFSLDDHIRATKGVECRKDEGVIDETPKAYKDIDSVMKSQGDLVSIKHTLKQVLCVKG